MALLSRGARCDVRSRLLEMKAFKHIVQIETPTDFVKRHGRCVYINMFISHGNMVEIMYMLILSWQLCQLFRHSEDGSLNQVKGKELPPEVWPNAKRF